MKKKSLVALLATVAVMGLAALAFAALTQTFGADSANSWGAFNLKNDGTYKVLATSPDFNLGTADNAEENALFLVSNKVVFLNDPIVSGAVTSADGAAVSRFVLRTNTDNSTIQPVFVFYGIGDVTELNMKDSGGNALVRDTSITGGSYATPKSDYISPVMPVPAVGSTSTFSLTFKQNGTTTTVPVEVVHLSKTGNVSGVLSYQYGDFDPTMANVTTFKTYTDGAADTLDLGNVYVGTSKKFTFYYQNSHYKDVTLPVAAAGETRSFAFGGKKFAADPGATDAIPGAVAGAFTFDLASTTTAPYVKTFIFGPAANNWGAFRVQWTPIQLVKQNVTQGVSGLGDLTVDMTDSAVTNSYLGSGMTAQNVDAAKVVASVFSAPTVSDAKAVSPVAISLDNGTSVASDKVLVLPLRVKFTLRQDAVDAKMGNGKFAALKATTSDRALLNLVAPMKIFSDGTVVNLASKVTADSDLAKYFTIVRNVSDIQITYLVNIADAAAASDADRVQAKDGYFLIFDGAKDSKIVDPMYCSEVTVTTPTPVVTVTTTPTGAVTATPTSGGSSSSGGCSAFGFAPMALLLLAPLALLRKRG